MPKQAKDFDGQVNTDAIPFQGKASYDEYVFRGSLVQHTGTVGNSQGIITTKDYFFQQTTNGTMKLYPYTEGKTYGIRGFSGWFHKTEISNSKASELSLSLFDDGSTTPIETVKVDDLNRDTSGKVYSVSGVLVKNNAADLNSLSNRVEHAVNVATTSRCRVELGQLHILVNGHAYRYVRECEHLGDGDLHDHHIHVCQS